VVSCPGNNEKKIANRFHVKQNEEEEG